MEKTGERSGILMVVDTNVFVDAFRSHTPAAAFFQRVEGSQVLFSAVSEAELVAGKSCEDRTVKANTLRFLSQFRKIPLDNRIAVLAGDLRRMYGMELPDAFIAATAVTQHAVLVTKNARHFAVVAGLGIQEP